MKPITVVLVAIGVLLFVVGFVYLTTKVRDLPGFLGGQKPGKRFPNRFRTTYKKRAVASFVLGILAFAGAYYTSGLRRRSLRRREPPASSVS